MSWYSSLHSGIGGLASVRAMQSSPLPYKRTAVGGRRQLRRRLGLAALLPPRPHGDLQAEEEPVDQDDDDVAEGLERDVEREPREVEHLGGGVVADPDAVGAPVQLVLLVGEPLVGHHAVGQEQHAEHVGGGQHRLAPTDRSAGRAALPVGDDGQREEQRAEQRHDELHVHPGPLEHVDRHDHAGQVLLVNPLTTLATTPRRQTTGGLPPGVYHALPPTPEPPTAGRRAKDCETATAVELNDQPPPTTAAPLLRPDSRARETTLYDADRDGDPRAFAAAVARTARRARLGWRRGAGRPAASGRRGRGAGPGHALSVD